MSRQFACQVFRGGEAELCDEREQSAIGVFGPTLSRRTVRESTNLGDPAVRGFSLRHHEDVDRYSYPQIKLINNRSSQLLIVACVAGARDYRGLVAAMFRL